MKCNFMVRGKKPESLGKKHSICDKTKTSKKSIHNLTIRHHKFYENTYDFLFKFI